VIRDRRREEGRARDRELAHGQRRRRRRRGRGATCPPKAKTLDRSPVIAPRSRRTHLVQLRAELLRDDRAHVGEDGGLVLWFSRRRRAGTDGCVS